MVEPTDSKPGLKISEQTQELLTKNVADFFNWLDLLKLRRLESAPKISFEFSSTDDTLVVGDDNVLHFNLDYLNKCSDLYFLTIVLHEAYHVYINDIPNKRDATRVKDLYHNHMMLYIDIEADYYVAKFFKEKHSYNLSNYFGIYYQGASTFSDNEIRPYKFERFVCSMLTICHLFTYNSMAIYRLSSEAVRLYRNKKPKAIIHKGTHSESRNLDLSINELYVLQDLYHEPLKFGEDEYIEKLVSILLTAINENKNISPSLTFL